MDPEPSLFLNYVLDTRLALAFLILFLLLLFSAMVSGAQFALFSLSQKDIDDNFQNHSSKAKVLSKLIENPNRLLSTLVLANNLINIGAITIFFLIGKKIVVNFPPTFLKVSFLVICIGFVILLFGKYFPKFMQVKIRSDWQKELHFQWLF